MHRYAQVNIATGMIEGDSFLRDAGMEEYCPELIPVSYDFDLTNKKYDFETKSFIDCV